MRKFTLLALAAAGLLLHSCKKTDHPLPKKLCQIKTIMRSGGPTISGTMNYYYNDQRLCIQNTFQVFSTISYLYQYDSKERLVSMNEQGITFYNLFYEHGLISRIDVTDAGGTLVSQSHLIYDNKKRLVQRDAMLGDLLPGVIRWEYEGNSRNPARRIMGTLATASAPKAGHGSTPLPDIIPAIIYEFEYDNKINPQATLVGWPLTPIFFGQENAVDRFEPIPDNNITYIRFLGDPGNGSLFRYKEYFITYQYNNNYPVSETHRMLQYFYPDGGPTERMSTATYEYECKN